MDKHSISLYLEKFKEILGGETMIRDTIIRVISEKTGATIDPKDVSIKNGTVRIQGSSYLKNEVYMNKEEIIEALSRLIPIGKVIDIK